MVAKENVFKAMMSREVMAPYWVLNLRDNLNQ